MKKRIFKVATLSIALLAALSSCKKDDDVIDVTDELVVPDTYDFEDVSFSGQINRQDMLSELKAHIQTAHVLDNSVELDTSVLFDMYVEGIGFADTELNESGKKLGNKTADFFYDDAIAYLTEAAEASMATDTATESTYGVRTRGEKILLVDAKGFEYVQVISKGLMGATFLDQALNNYLNDIELDDNTDDSYEEGKGTTMAHHWDEAYGYFTDNVNFPTEGTDRFWGNYSEKRDGVIGSNEAIGYAFRKGRAAIVAEDIEVVKEQAEIIKTEWAKLAAACAIHYFNEGRADYTEVGTRLHALSEGFGFLQGVKAAGGDVDDIISTLESTGLYDITEAQLSEFATTVATEFGLTSVQSAL